MCVHITAKLVHSSLFVECRCRSLYNITGFWLAQAKTNTCFVLDYTKCRLQSPAETPAASSVAAGPGSDSRADLGSELPLCKYLEGLEKVMEPQFGPGILGPSKSKLYQVGN